MNVSEALLKRRTIRKFTQKKIEKNDLMDLIEYARLAAYPANLQPLKFAIIDNDADVAKVFPLTKWAGYLPDGGPKSGEEPTAYIVVLGDKSVKSSFEVEAGAAVTSMMLGAWEKGIASCWLGSVNRKKFMEEFKLSEDDYSLVYVLALGYPAQESQICEMTDSVKYFEDENKVLNVPKRSVNEILIEL